MCLKREWGAIYGIRGIASNPIDVQWAFETGANYSPAVVEVGTLGHVTSYLRVH